MVSTIMECCLKQELMLLIGTGQTQLATATYSMKSMILQFMQVWSLGIIHLSNCMSEQLIFHRLSLMLNLVILRDIQQEIGIGHGDKFLTSRSEEHTSELQSRGHL